ncbi:MtrAB system histidine kinase MtrB [Trueperella sp. LYQ141]|uniref:MtrAB system histidine kinase MtrB n=1 Tax=Trueperella sp. LYQ141 TaxID=3391058 RepID=UPI0039837137
MSERSGAARVALVARRLGRIRQRWDSSLSLRVMVSIICAGVIGIILIGSGISAQMRDSVFDRAVDSSIELFANDVRLAESRFAASAPTVGRTQEVANELVSSMYDPARGTLGAVLIRSAGQDPVPTQIYEPATASATQVRSLVSAELRATVTQAGKIGWQSVQIATEDETVPGIIVGTTLTIPGSGVYELYTAYSMQSPNSMIHTTARVVWISVVAFLLILGLMTWAVMRWVLSPVRQASRNAKALADGEFHTRMTVRGTDEIAQLARSFNQMAESLEKQFTQMERMSRVQTEFVSAVSHELRSPVTTVRMAGQLIYDKREELPPALRRSAELQYNQLLNLDATLADLLEISRYDAGGMTLATKTVDVADIVREVIDMSEPLAQNNHTRMEFSTDGDTVAEIEPRRIQRVVRNLVVNALEHAERNPVRIRVVGNDTAVAVEVQDNGVGLSAEQIIHVFERFWRADASRVRTSGGTGLGLTIAREDAQIHGGSLDAAGELGVGSTFLLTLPKVPHESYLAPITLRAPQPLAVPTELIVDAQPVTQMETPYVGLESQLTVDDSAQERAVSVAIDQEGQEVQSPGAVAVGEMDVPPQAEMAYQEEAAEVESNSVAGTRDDLGIASHDFVGQHDGVVAVQPAEKNRITPQEEE